MPDLSAAAAGLHRHYARPPSEQDALDDAVAGLLEAIARLDPSEVEGRNVLYDIDAAAGAVAAVVVPTTEETK